jgi:hypothetical protein
MFFLLFGSSASGKTAALTGVRERVRDLVAHDFDEIGVPPDADTAWRQRANEEWVRRVLRCQRDGRDFLLAGQVPLGEILAAPSTPELKCPFCLPARLRRRGSSWADPDAGAGVG